MRSLLHAKIHRATITDANINYEGSITLPPELLEASGIVEYEAVSVWNITNGSRFNTYAICGEAPASAQDSATICVNGAAARLVSVGDLVIVASFVFLDENQLSGYKPRVVFVNAKNRLVPA